MASNTMFKLNSLQEIPNNKNFFFQLCLFNRKTPYIDVVMNLLIKIITRNAFQGIS